MLHSAVKDACEFNNGMSDGMCPAGTTNILMRDIFKEYPTFEGSFEGEFQGE